MAEIIPLHDWIASEEIDQLARENAALLEAKFASDAAVFKAQVILQLMNQGAYHSGAGWAIYETPPEYEGNVAVQDEGKKVLIIATGAESPGLPSVKLYVNQDYYPGSEHHSIRTEEVSIDQNNNAQHVVDVLVEGGDATIEDQLPRVPIFGVNDDGRLMMTTNPESQRFNIISYVDNLNTHYHCFPLGHFYFLEHRIAALEKAKELFSETASMQVRHVFVPRETNLQPEQPEDFVEKDSRPDE